MSKKKRLRNLSSTTPIQKAPAGRRQKHARRSALLAAACVLVAAAGAYLWWRNSMPPPAATTSATAIVGAAHFVGAKACAECHAGEYSAWQSSQHAKAMQHATDATVLGDFNDAKYDYDGIVSTFFRRDGKFFVTTDGKDGQLADFEIQYTFGVYPLQQYLVGFPDGRLQPLPIAWDSRPREQGGARWYHLYPNEHLTNRNPLHWTRLAQNWNWMCADCHTTKLERNYNAADNTYATKWSEMNVACEACHGPGSNHVAASKHEAGYDKLAAHGLVVALDEREGVRWIPDAATGNAKRSAPLTTQRELGVCAQCHSRRAPFAKGMDHDGRLFDTHDIALLTDALYFPDGQQRDEVYDVGSFLQSRMHAHGVTCSDCHDPHSGTLRAPGNAVCAQCHASARYDVPAHTLHPANSVGSQCAECHMPTRDYMVIDARHDHSIRIPRPDQSAALDTPNACNDCHRNRSATWAAGIIEHAFGPERKGFQTFGAALHDGRTGVAGAGAQLTALASDANAPAIARATALSGLRPYLGEASMPLIQAGLADADPMVRGAALDTLMAAPIQQRLQLALGMLDDSSPIVRIKAARVLAIMPDQGGKPEFRAQLDKVFAEYVASQQANADRPEAHMNLGLFYAERRRLSEAEAEYESALALEPDFVPAYVNLADLYQRQKREDDAEKILSQGAQHVPDSADLSHALGLLRVRQGRTADAIPLLARAAQLDAGSPRFAYVYGVALHDTGEPKKGIAVLEKALVRFPNDPELLNTLAAYARDAGDTKRADAYAKRLAAIIPPSQAPASAD